MIVENKMKSKELKKVRYKSNALVPLSLDLMMIIIRMLILSQVSIILIFGINLILKIIKKILVLVRLYNKYNKK